MEGSQNVRPRGAKLDAELGTTLCPRCLPVKNWPAALILSFLVSSFSLPVYRALIVLPIVSQHLVCFWSDTPLRYPRLFSFAGTRPFHLTLTLLNASWIALLVASNAEEEVPGGVLPASSWEGLRHQQKDRQWRQSSKGTPAQDGQGLYAGFGSMGRVGLLTYVLARLRKFFIDTGE